MFDVHESDAGAGGKIEGGHAGAVNVDGQIHEWRAVGFLMCGHAQRGHAILGEAFVAQAVELAFAGDARQLGFEFRQIRADRACLTSDFVQACGSCQSLRLGLPRIAPALG